VLLFFQLAFALLIAIVWGASYGVSIISGTPSPPAELSGLMLAAMTWLFSLAARTASGPRPRRRRLLRRRIIEMLEEVDDDGDGEGGAPEDDEAESR
jgi:hypothetical protein